MSRVKVYVVALSGADREWLVKVVSSGTHPARMIMRARVLLALDEDTGPVEDRAVIARQVGVSETTVGSIAQRFVETEGDVEATTTRKQRLSPPVPSVITGEVEARLIALACSTPPAGWLNIAEIELSVLTGQCLDRRIDDLNTLNTELAAWQHWP